MKDFIENLHFILLNIGYSELNANWNWKEIYSPFARIYYVKEGRARTKIKDVIYDLEPNHLYLTPPFTLHDDECDSNFSLYYIHFYEQTNRRESLFDKFEFPIEIHANELDLKLTERLLQINPDRYLKYFDPQLYDNPPTFSHYIAENNKMPLHTLLETRGILNLLISRFLASARPKFYDENGRINKILHYIHQNIDKDLSVALLADRACLSEDHFIRVFKQKMDCTPLKYINLKKIEKALLLLLTTDMSIKDIAFEISIDNVSYFNRMFKKQTGCTPREYREEYSR